MTLISKNNALPWVLSDKFDEKVGSALHAG